MPVVRVQSFVVPFLTLDLHRPLDSMIRHYQGPLMGTLPHNLHWVPAFILTFVVTTAGAQQTEVVDLVILAGQSNAVGFDAAPSKLKANPIDQQIMFWWRCGDPPPDEHDSIGSAWGTLRSQPLGDPVKPKKGRQYGNFAQDEGGFGPEFGFARTIAETSQRRIAVLKVAFNGTGISRDWDPDSTGEDSCYRVLVEEFQRSVEAATAKGMRLRPRAFLWVQGESDANAKDAALYQTRLRTMLSRLRQVFETPVPAFVAVNTNFGSGKNRFMPAIVKAQQDHAESDPRTVYVDTSKCAVINGAHFSAEGTIEVGELFARALIEWEQSARGDKN